MRIADVSREEFEEAGAILRPSRGDQRRDNPAHVVGDDLGRVVMARSRMLIAGVASATRRAMLLVAGRPYFVYLNRPQGFRHTAAAAHARPRCVSRERHAHLHSLLGVTRRFVQNSTLSVTMRAE